MKRIKFLHFNVTVMLPVQVLGLEEVFDSKRAINEAFYFAKNSSPVSNIMINKMIPFQ